MTISLIKTGIVLFSCTAIAIAHGNELINFGKECLVKEERLDEVKSRLDALSLQTERTQRKNSQAINYLERYQMEKEELETSMTDCAETTPNSAYCHQIRQRYNELTYLIQRVEVESIENDFGGNDVTINYEITRNNFNQRYDDFIALCRDSNIHYALIQNPTAYAEVCSTPKAKESITCSFF